MNNDKAYGLLVAATKATFAATNRSWDALTELEQGERINAQRAGFAVILEDYEQHGYGMRTAFMKALVEATAGPSPLDAEDAVSSAKDFIGAIARGENRYLTTAEAKAIVAGLESVELAD